MISEAVLEHSERVARTGRGGPRRTRIFPIALAALIINIFGLSAAAAQDDPFGWITHLFQPAPASPVVKPRPKIRRAEPRAAANVRPQARWRDERWRDERWRDERWRNQREEKEPENAAAKPAEPAAPPTYFVVVIGDSLGQMLGQGLTEAFADRPAVAILRKAKENSGLVRDDFYDWTKAAQDLLASGAQINFAVMMIGSNDRQTLRDGNGGAFELHTPQWSAAYAQRIETIATMFRDKKIPLIWVGLPVLKSDRLSADASAFNDLYREYAGKAGATYVDVWEAFANDAGEYSAMGPDVNGQIVKLRAADGIHFTKAGALKLAHFVEPEIRRNLEETQPQPTPESPAISAPAETNAPPQDGAPPDGATPNSASLGAPQDEATTPVPPAPRPLAGPVLPLTGPVRAPGGELASRAANAQAAKQILRLEERGDAEPGRADDFSWPRP